MADEEWPRLRGRRIAWQLQVFGEAVAPVRRSRAEACEDALALGHGSRDHPGASIYVTVPASVEMIFLEG